MGYRGSGRTCSPPGSSGWRERGSSGARRFRRRLGSNVYELTVLGRELEPVLVALSRWGARLLDDPSEDDEVRAGWAAVALRSAVPAGASDGRPGTYGFRIDGEVFHLRVGGEEVEVRQGPAPDHDLVVQGDAGTLLAVASGRLSPEEAVQSGALKVEEEREGDGKPCSPGAGT